METRFRSISCDDENEINDNSIESKLFSSLAYNNSHNHSNNTIHVISPKTFRISDRCAFTLKRKFEDDFPESPECSNTDMKVFHDFDVTEQVKISPSILPFICNKPIHSNFEIFHNAKDWDHNNQDPRKLLKSNKLLHHYPQSIGIMNNSSDDLTKRFQESNFFPKISSNSMIPTTSTANSNFHIFHESNQLSTPTPSPRSNPNSNTSLTHVQVQVS